MSTILLVEDEVLNRTLVKAVLARADVAAVREAEILDAASLSSARERLINDPVDLVLLDMTLPAGNGLPLARELAGGTGTPAGGHRPVVVAVTASVLPQDRAAAIEAGCDGFLDKPYAAADLVAIVASHLPG